MIVVADDAVKVVFGPQVTFSLLVQIDFARTASFPSLGDIAEGVFFPLFDKDVNVVGHDAPSNKSVSEIMSFEERVLHDLGVLEVAEMTFAVASVFVVSDSAGEFSLGFLVGFSVRRFEKGVEFGFPFFDDGGGEAIGFSESDGL